MKKKKQKTVSSEDLQAWETSLANLSTSTDAVVDKETVIILSLSIPKGKSCIVDKEAPQGTCPVIQHLYLPFDDVTGAGTFYRFRECLLLAPAGPNEHGSIVLLLRNPYMAGKIINGDDSRESLAELVDDDTAIKWCKIQESVFLRAVESYQKDNYHVDSDGEILAIGRFEGADNKELPEQGHLYSSCTVQFLAVCDAPKYNDIEECQRVGNAPCICQSCEDADVSGTIMDNNVIQNPSVKGDVDRANREYNYFLESGCADSGGLIEGYLMPLLRKLAQEYGKLESLPSECEKELDFYGELAGTIKKIADEISRACAEARKAFATKELMGVCADLEIFRSSQASAEEDSDELL